MGENKMLEPTPKDVIAIDDYKLIITFNNGEKRIYDMKENLKFKFYEKLKNKEVFKNVKIDGINIQWITGEDIAPEELYYGSIPIKE